LFDPAARALGGGERLASIGRNVAGNSSLLKVLAGLCKPDGRDAAQARWASQDGQARDQRVDQPLQRFILNRRLALRTATAAPRCAWRSRLLDDAHSLLLLGERSDPVDIDAHESSPAQSLVSSRRAAATLSELACLARPALPKFDAQAHDPSV
jgi:ABC-type transport system involved in cytochrome c biogenesis ATPase subunit